LLENELVGQIGVRTKRTLAENLTSDIHPHHGWSTIPLTPDLPGSAIESMVSYPKGQSMDDRSQLAERIVDQVADAVIYASRAGVIICWNRASAALFGFSAEEALGQSLDLIIPEHLRASHWRGFEAAITKGTMKLEGRPTLTRALHKSGRKLYVEMTFAIVKDETKGEVLGSVAMARDITDRVERERAATRAS
jgi:PAS domain S-box-containing protein